MSNIMPSIEIIISDDLTSLAVMLPTEPRQPLRMTTGALDELISELGQVRARMVPNQPEGWELSRGVDRPFRNPTWEIYTDGLAADPIMRIRHPGYGWLHFIFTKQKAQTLARSLMEAVAAVPREMKGNA